MLKRISTPALLLSFCMVAACQDGADANANPAPQAETAPSVRAPRVQPIQAVFTQAKFSTVYTAVVANPGGDELVFAWSGPGCGVIAPENVTSSDASATTKLTWMHASPPCPAHSSHDETTVTLQVIGKRSGRTITCSYKGAETGTGPSCYQPGFRGTELGHPEKNTAFIRYRIPQAKSCSKVDLIQVLSTVRKGSDVPLRSHLDGMDPDELSLTGYQPPAAEDDVDGYVVDKFVYADLPSPEPYYGGSVSGTKTKDAELDDRPNNTREGHVARFDVCAFCSGNPSDAEYGKYLECYRWEHDADSGAVKTSDPQPTQTPPPGFEAAVAKWNANKKFTMPGK